LDYSVAGAGLFEPHVLHEIGVGRRQLSAGTKKVVIVDFLAIIVTAKEKEEEDKVNM